MNPISLSAYLTDVISYAGGNNSVILVFIVVFSLVSFGIGLVQEILKGG